jgi:hypothetical protein
MRALFLCLIPTYFLPVPDRFLHASASET